MPKFSATKFNEHVFEIRFKPNPKIIDHYGHWASELSVQSKLENWRVASPTRVDVYNNIDIKEANERAFFTVKNAGLIKIDCFNKDVFPNKSSQIMKYLLSKDEFGNKPHVDRIGIRVKFGNFYQGTFEDLTKNFLKHYISPNDNIPALFNGSLFDIGAPLEFETPDGKIKSSAGPMNNEQMPDYFKHPSHLKIIGTGKPEVIFYFEIDYSIEPISHLDLGKIRKHIQKFSSEAWRINESLKQLLMKK